MRSAIVQKLKFIFEAPAYRVGPPALNRMGLQGLRMWWENVGATTPQFAESDPDARYKRELNENGICLVENFLSAEDFARLEAAYDRYMESANVRKVINKNGTGITWWEGIISRSRDYKEEADVMTSLLSNNPRILELASSVLGRPVNGPLTLGYQIMHCPEDQVDDKDVEGVLHADRHYTCVKAFFFVNDNKVENGAYVFCPGSHKLTKARMRAENLLAAQYQAWDKTKKPDPTLGTYERNYPALSPESRREMGIREWNVEAKKNSLAVSNNMGFHRRGVLSPGQTRKHIRILFYDEQAPLYGRLVKRAFKWWRDRERS